MASRRGLGTIYQRKDGRWQGSAWLLVRGGGRRRLSVYGRSRKETADKLAERLEQDRHSIPAAEASLTLASYLDYWLRDVVPRTVRPNTRLVYEAMARNHIAPRLGHLHLAKLTVPDVQAAVNSILDSGGTAHIVQKFRTVLSSALTRAMREEYLTRNVARLVQIPATQPSLREPWNAEEARRFLVAAHGHRWEPAFILLVLYGLRRGEAMGLRWSDVNWTKGTFTVQQQVFRAGPELLSGPVKTRAGMRTLPVLPLLREALQRIAAEQGIDLSDTARLGDLLITISKAGGIVEPHSLVRVFRTFCKRAGVRRIRIHDTRHTTATLLKNAGVPARDAQLILGHADITTTQQIYQHADIDGQLAGLTAVAAQLSAPSITAAHDGENSRQNGRKNRDEGPDEGENEPPQQGSEHDGDGRIGATPESFPRKNRDIHSPAPTLPTSLLPLLRELPDETLTVLHSRTNARFLGASAVRTAVNFSTPAPLSQQLYHDRRALKWATDERLRCRAYPFSLVPPAHPQPMEDAHP